MIGRLAGAVIDCRPDELLIDVHGVGYQLQIPLSTFYPLTTASGPVALFVHTHVREDAIQLFGFWTEQERSLFLRLIAVSGVGPKIALAVLSGIGVADLERALRDGDRAMLERIPGIGRKTAERVLLELKDRPALRRGRPPTPPAESPAASGVSRPDADAVSALVHLGYSDQDAYSAIMVARRELGEEAPIEGLLRSALQSLVR